MKHFNKKIAIAMLCTTVMSSFPVPSLAASDIKGHWAEASIAQMQSQGYIGGYSDGSFHPDKEITRAEFVAALNKILGLTGDGDLHFSDVKTNDWFAKELAIALKYGYIGGYEDGTFRPNQPVSRIEAAVMISRANRLSEKYDASPSDLKDFKDSASIPNWAKGELAVVVKSGIMKGKLEKFFQGNSKITRAEAVVSLSRAKEVRETLGIQTVATEAQKEAPKPNEAPKIDQKKPPENKPAASGGGGGGGFSSGSGGGGGGGSSAPSAPSQPSPVPSPSTPGKPDSNSSSGSGSTGGSSNTGAPSVTPAPAVPNPGQQTPPGGNSQDGAGENPPNKSKEGSSGPSIPTPAPAPPSREENTSPGENSSGGSTENASDPSPQNPSTENQTDGSTNTGAPSGPSAPSIDQSTNEKTIEQLKQELQSGINKNVTHYTKYGKERAIIWTMGITAPTIDENGSASSDFKKLIAGGHVDYLMNYKAGNKWYDVNKKDTLDQVLCSGAVASNMLHWWLEQNKDYVSDFIKTSPTKGIIDTKENYTDFKNLATFINSFNSDDSKIFNMIKVYFGNLKEGVWPHHMLDLFINGYTPNSSYSSPFQKDNRGGFLHPVFGEQVLSKKDEMKNYKTLSDSIKDNLMKGNALAVSYLVSGNNYTYIHTIWGAEYDLKGKLTAVYTSDSDDEASVMKRLDVKYKDENNKPKISSNIKDPEHGSIVHELYSLSLGTEQWEQYFATQKQNQAQAQPQNQVTAQGQDPATTPVGDPAVATAKAQDPATVSGQDQVAPRSVSASQTQGDTTAVNIAQPEAGAPTATETVNGAPAESNAQSEGTTEATGENGTSSETGTQAP